MKNEEDKEIQCDISRVPRFKDCDNAYDVLDQVIEVIEADNRRYYQGSWIRRRVPTIGSIQRHEPACGTIACVAGWITVMKNGVDSTMDAEYGSPMDIAGKLLGLNVGEQLVLFGGNAAGEFSEQTQAQHAAAGVQHIRDFQQKHANQLKAKKITRKELGLD